MATQRATLLLRAHELLEQPRPVGDRTPITYYGKEIPVPLVGDIICVWLTNFDMYYMLVLNVRNETGKTGLRYYCVSLYQKGLNGAYTPSSLRNRDEFEILDDKSKFFEIFPKQKNRVELIKIFPY